MSTRSTQRTVVESRSVRGRRWLGGAVLAGLVAVVPVVGASGPARAQEAPGSVSAGITVVGYGEASAPAETAELQILVSEVNFGGPVSPSPDAVPGQAEREAVGPLVEALVGVGIAEDDISIVVSPVLNQFFGPSGPGVARVDVTVDEPTRERIDELLSLAVVGAAEENLVIGQVGAGYGVADCAALERGAREAAFADAEERADLQAEVMGLTRGDAVASSDVPAGSASFDPYLGPRFAGDGACAPATQELATGAAVSFPSYDPTGDPEVSVYAQVAVTFAVDGSGADATPTA